MGIPQIFRESGAGATAHVLCVLHLSRIMDSMRGLNFDVIHCPDWEFYKTITSLLVALPLICCVR